MSSSKAALLVLATAVLFSTGGAAIKFAAAQPWQIAGLRSLTAFLILVILVPAVRRRWNGRVLLLGLPYAGVMLLFVHANTMASAASVTLLQASAPLYVILLAPWLLNQPFSKQTGLILPLFVAGLWMLFSGVEDSTQLATNPTLGRGLAAGAGLCFGLIILGLSSVQSRKGALQSEDQATVEQITAEIAGTSRPVEDESSATAIQAVAWGNLLAFLISVPFLVGNWTALGAVDVGVVLYLGCFQIGLAYVFLLAAMRVLPAVEISLLLLVELVASPFFAALLHGEMVGRQTVLGGLLIIAGCGFHAWMGRRASMAVPNSR